MGRGRRNQRAAAKRERLLRERQQHELTYQPWLFADDDLEAIDRAESRTSVTFAFIVVAVVSTIVILLAANA